jgi:hypothetical protein
VISRELCNESGWYCNHGTREGTIGLVPHFASMAILVVSFLPHLAARTGEGWGCNKPTQAKRRLEWATRCFAGGCRGRSFLVEAIYC